MYIYAYIYHTIVHTVHPPHRYFLLHGDDIDQSLVHTTQLHDRAFDAFHRVRSERIGERVRVCM